MTSIRGLACRSVATALIIGSLAVGPAHSGPVCSSAPRFESLHIKMKVAEKAYRIGETGVFHFTISRPADKDPFEQGIPIDPPFRYPAEGVNITLSLYAKEGLPRTATGGPTDSEGRTTIKTQIDERFADGVDYAHVYAYIYYPKVACLDPEEFGSRTYKKPFDIKN